MLEHLRAHPMEFQGLLVSITMQVCPTCPEPHPVILVHGPEGDARTRAETVKQALLFLVELGYRMAKQDKPDAWELIGTVADWATAARSSH